jgi:Uma2 family endonuclease
MSSQLTREPATVLGNGYPTSDGRPMAETDLHRDLMVDLIETLKNWFAADPQTYVSGNILLFYEPGNKRRHVSPDVLVVRGIAKLRRDNYLVWEEGKAPDLVIEVTSKTTRTRSPTCTGPSCGFQSTSCSTPGRSISTRHSKASGSVADGIRRSNL